MRCRDPCPERQTGRGAASFLLLLWACRVVVPIHGAAPSPPGTPNRLLETQWLEPAGECCARQATDDEVVGRH